MGEVGIGTGAEEGDAGAGCFASADGAARDGVAALRRSVEEGGSGEGEEPDRAWEGKGDFFGFLRWVEGV